MSAVTYGERPTWSPERPRLKLRQILLAWLVAAGALLIAAWIVPGVHVNGFGGAVVASAVIAVLNAFLPPHRRRRCGCRSWWCSASCSCSSSTRRCSLATSHLIPQWHHGRLVRLGARRGADRGGGLGRAPGDPRHERRRHLHVPDRAADREAAGRAGAHRRAGDHLPRDRRARAPGAAARDARRQRARDGALARRRARTGSRNGRPTSRRRPARARPGSCSARTTTSPRSAGSRRRRRR